MSSLEQEWRPRVAVTHSATVLAREGQSCSLDLRKGVSNWSVSFCPFLWEDSLVAVIAREWLQGIVSGVMRRERCPGHSTPRDSEHLASVPTIPGVLLFLPQSRGCPDLENLELWHETLWFPQRIKRRGWGTAPETLPSFHWHPAARHTQRPCSASSPGFPLVPCPPSTFLERVAGLLIPEVTQVFTPGH